jgi:hypothetical protein
VLDVTPWQKGEPPAAAPAVKVAGVLRGLETYVSGQSDLIIDYATTKHSDEPISTGGHREHGAVVAAPPMGAKQQMRWSPRGVHLITQGPNLGHERNLQPGPCCRGALGTSPVSKCGVITPKGTDGLNRAILPILWRDPHYDEHTYKARHLLENSSPNSSSIA